MAGASSNLQLYNAQTGRKLGPLATGQPSSIERAAFTPKGDLVITQGICGEFCVTDAETGASVYSMPEAERATLCDWQVGPAGDIVLLRKNGTIQSLDPRTRQFAQLREVPTSREDFADGKLWVSADGHCVVARAPHSSTIHVWTADL